MDEVSQDTRQRARDIRAEALAKLAERDGVSLASLRDEIAELKSMARVQTAQLQVLIDLVTALTAKDEIAEDRSALCASTPRPLSVQKRRALERIRSLRADNVSFARICEIFHQERIPTLSGDGYWSKGTLWNLWKNHRHQLDQS